jgi:hypothetical protein
MHLPQVAAPQNERPRRKWNVAPPKAERSGGGDSKESIEGDLMVISMEHADFVVIL